VAEGEDAGSVLWILRSGVPSGLRILGVTLFSILVVGALRSGLAAAAGEQLGGAASSMGERNYVAWGAARPLGSIAIVVAAASGRVSIVRG
jgi:hypothetical protein